MKDFSEYEAIDRELENRAKREREARERLRLAKEKLREAEDSFVPFIALLFVVLFVLTMLAKFMG